MKTGDTIIFRPSDSGNVEFYWLCDISDGDYLLFSWFGNPYAPSPSDYWKVSRARFDERVAEGEIEIYDSLPLDKYGDIFERQAIERNN